MEKKQKNFCHLMCIKPEIQKPNELKKWRRRNESEKTTDYKKFANVSFWIE